MSTFSEIYFNGNEYGQMWFNGNMIWKKDSGGIVYPYKDADSVITYMNTSTSATSKTFTVIDSSLPYSINGTATNSFSFPANSETQVKLVNLKPTSAYSQLFPTKIEQLRIPNLTDLNFLFQYFCYDLNYEYSWSPQYFEFSDSVTSMVYMFGYCHYLTDEMMAQLMPYFPNTSQVTNMTSMFEDCSSLTSLDLSSWDVDANFIGGNGFRNMFKNCISLRTLNLSTWDTSGIDDNSNSIYIYDMFLNLTSDIYVNKNTWTLDTHFCSYNATNANFILVDDNGSQEEVFKPQYHTEFASTSNLPSWLSVYSKDDEYYFAYSSSSSCYYSTNTKYYSTTAENVFQVDAPMTGTLKIYLSSNSYDNDYFMCSNKLTSESSYGENTSFYFTNTSVNYANSKRCHVYEMPVVVGESYHVQVRFNQGNSGTSAVSYSNSGYIFGFAIEYIPITNIKLTHDIEDIFNMEQKQFTITPTYYPTNCTLADLEVIYDSTYLETEDNLKFKLKDGCQGQTLTITYRSKSDNSVSNGITFYVSESLEFPVFIVDYSQSTAPTLPDYMTVDGTGTYKFNHGMFMADVYGLCSQNKASSSSTAYIRYKYVAPTSGNLTFTYRFDSGTERSYDYMTVHVDNSTSQPTYSSATNRVVTTKGSRDCKDADGTASISVVEGTTYYIHIQYRKDSKGNNGLDMGCIRKIELK